MKASKDIKHRLKQKGASLVEAAVGLSVFLILILMYFDVCWILYESMAWQYLVNRNIRILTVGTFVDNNGNEQAFDEAGVIDRLRAEASNWLLSCPTNTCTIETTNTSISGAEIDGVANNDNLRRAGFRALRVRKEHKGILGRMMTVNITAEALGRIEATRRESVFANP